MRKKDKEKIRFRIALGFLIIVLLVIIGTLLYNFNQFYGAYLSTKMDCYPNTQLPSNVITAGKISTNITGQQTITIFINDTGIIRHELCHYYQHQQHKSFSCNNLPGVFFNELQCYFIQKDTSPLTNQEINLLKQLT